VLTARAWCSDRLEGEWSRLLCLSVGRHCCLYWKAYQQPDVLEDPSCPSPDTSPMCRAMWTSVLANIECGGVVLGCEKSRQLRANTNEGSVQEWLGRQQYCQYFLLERTGVSFPRQRRAGKSPRKEWAAFGRVGRGWSRDCFWSRASSSDVSLLVV
jgi:hypothetical protein